MTRCALSMVRATRWIAIAVIAGVIAAGSQPVSSASSAPDLRAAASFFASADWARLLPTMGIGFSIVSPALIGGPDGPNVTVVQIGTEKFPAEFDQMVASRIGSTSIAIVPLSCYCNYGPMGALVFGDISGRLTYLSKVVFNEGGTDVLVHSGSIYALTRFTRPGESNASSTGIAIRRFALDGKHLRQVSSLETTTGSQQYRAFKKTPAIELAVRLRQKLTQAGTANPH